MATLSLLLMTNRSRGAMSGDCVDLAPRPERTLLARSDGGVLVRVRPDYFFPRCRSPMVFPSVSWMIAFRPTDWISIFGITILPPSFSTSREQLVDVLDRHVIRDELRHLPFVHPAHGEGPFLCFSGDDVLKLRRGNPLRVQEVPWWARSSIRGETGRTALRGRRRRPGSGSIRYSAWTVIPTEGTYILWTASCATARESRPRPAAAARRGRIPSSPGRPASRNRRCSGGSAGSNSSSSCCPSGSEGPRSPWPEAPGPGASG